MPKYVEKINQQNVSKLHDEEDEGSDNTSGLSSLVYSGSNDEEFLRSTWTRLGVGHDGYLSLEELTKVCHTIGMERDASEVIEQLFSRLDVDGDGRISFEEFFHMFKSGIPSHSTSFNLDESQNQDSSLMLNTNCLSSVNNTSSGLFHTDYDVFSTLDPDGTGYVSVSRLVEIWFAMGISDGCHLLRDLGLPHRQRERIYLKDLAAVLEEEWRPQDPGTNLPRQAAFLILIYEIRGLRVALESARGERDKSRWDLNEANHRLSLFAQELDEHNIQIEEKTQHKIQSLEKQYKEQIRDLQESLSRERDCGREKALNESNEILSIKIQLQEEEVKLKGRIYTLEKDVKRLEAENVDMSDRLKDADHHLHSMEKQIGQLNHLKNKVAEYESLSPREEEFRSMCHRIEELMLENHRLRDNNDELIAQLDSVSAKNISGNIEDKSLDGSCIGDYLDQSCDASLQGGVKRRVFRSSVEEESSGPEEDSPRESKIRKKSQCINGANVHYVDVTSYDESFLDTSLPSSLYSKSPQHTHMLSSTRESVLSSHSLSSQPSSLPLNLFQSNYSSPKDRNCELRKRLDKRKKVDELEKEVESLKEEREKLNALVQEKKSLKGLSVSSDSEKEEGSVKVLLPPSRIFPETSKCLQCIDLESRLNLAIEELEMSLRRESQKQNDFEKEQDISLQQIQFLIQHCKELEEELSSVKTEVSHLMDERDQLLAEKENMKLDLFKKSNDSIANLIDNLCRELYEKIQRKRQALMASSVSTRSNEKSRDAITTIMEEEEPEDGDEADRDDASETSDGLTLDRIDDDMDAEDTIQERVRQMLEKLETQIGFFEEDMNREKDFQEKQKAMAEEKCRKAEHDLENIRCEFEKSDDYWNLKLQEEQDYYDEERKLYDEKFSALEAKIREYEEMALSVPEVPTEILGPASVGCGSTEEGPDRWPAIVGNISEDSDRLSTIDESVVWEKQVTELEDEVARLSKMVLLLQEEKENLITTWKEKVAAEQRISSKLKMDLEQTRSLFNKLESQANFNKEQLEHLKKNLVRESDSQKLAHVEQNKSTKEDSNITNLHNELKYFQNQTKRLENSLKLHQKNSTEILNITHERHKSEIQSREAMMAATQQMFTTNLAKYKDQLSKTSRSDSLLKELYVENAQLMVALAVTETRQKEAEVCARKYQMAALSSLSL